MSRPPKHNLLAALFTEVEREATKRRKSDAWFQKAVLLRGMLMPCQRILEADPARYVSVRAPRRTGKSTGVLFVVAIRCLERAASEWVVVGLTRPSVKRIYWGALQRLNDAFELGIKFQHQELTATFPNGSRIYFVGAENASEIEKLRGGKYDGVVIDECKSFGPLVFEELIQDVIGPALLDRNGQLLIIGTPGDDLAGPFYLATCEPPALLDTAGGKRQSNVLYGQRAEYPALWSLHAWTPQDNVTKFEDPRTGKVEVLWDRALRLKADMGWGDDHPTWRREYLGQWVPADRRRVYRYYPHKHDYVPCADTRWGLPPEIEDYAWQTCIGWDLGSKDGTAVVVWAWSPVTKGLWEIHSERRKSTKENPLNVSAIARWYRELDAEFGPFAGFPCDPAGLATMVMDTLASEHGVVLEPAEKREKLDHIELFNNDLDAGLIHIRHGSELGEELLEDKWLEKTIGTDKRKEDPSIPNDIADAGLYAFRWCRHRQARPAEHIPQMYSPAWWAQKTKQELAEAETRARAWHEPGVLDAEWWHEPS